MGRACLLSNKSSVCDVDYANGGVELGLNSHHQTTTLLIIKLPDSRALRVMSRSLLLAMFFFSLPSLFVTISSSTKTASTKYTDKDGGGFRLLPVLLRDLLDEGLVRKGQAGCVLKPGSIISSSPDENIGDDLEFLLKDSGVDLLIGSDGEKQAAFFDFVFALGFKGIDDQMGSINLKDDGLVIAPLGHDPSKDLKFLSSDYKVVYLRRFEDYTVVAMKREASQHMAAAKRVLCGVTAEKKKAALKRLEDVYLEPPRNNKKPRFTSRKIKFLPNLLKDSLEEYPRRVFISDDSNALDWFRKRYPTKGQEFEVVNSLEMSNNLSSKDYVVMKAEARVVEEMLKDKSLRLVDELFLECENKWSDGDESKRAYWQCLELYGKVRDQGIAVHQWWN